MPSPRLPSLSTLRRPLRCGLVALAAAVLLPAQADEILYRVQAGDTLIGLGQAMLADPRKWPRIQRLNGVADPYRIPVGTVLRIPTALLSPEPRAAEVAAVSGEVRGDGEPLTPGMTVRAGTELRSGADGHLVLRLPDGSALVLPADSSLRLDALQGYRGAEGQDVRLELQRGRVESRVVPQRGPAARYRIDTPTAVIGVRGTDFRVGTEPGAEASRAEVTEGRVEVRRPAQGARSAPAVMLPAGFGLVARAGGELSPPVPLLPAPPTEGIPALFEEPVLRVPLPDMEGVRTWRVQVGEDRDGAPSLADMRVDQGPARIAGLPDGRYRLVLRGIDGEGLEGIDAVHRFRLKARPEPPFLTTPPEGGKTSAGPVSFAWAEAPEAARYRIQIGTEEGFDAPVAEGEAIEGNAFTAELPPGRYHWRMGSERADGDRGPWSAAARFEVRPVPEAPQPPDIGDDTLDFRWSGEPGQRFEYQLAADEAFSAPISEGKVDEPRLSIPLPAADTYWMRVRSIDPDGFVSPWSGAQKVIVPAKFPWWMLLVPLFAL